jgi:hypothetical protein
MHDNPYYRNYNASSPPTACFVARTPPDSQLRAVYQSTARISVETIFEKCVRIAGEPLHPLHHSAKGFLADRERLMKAASAMLDAYEGSK